MNEQLSTLFFTIKHIKIQWQPPVLVDGHIPMCFGWSDDSQQTNATPSGEDELKTLKCHMTWSLGRRLVLKPLHTFSWYWLSIYIMTQQKHEWIFAPKWWRWLWVNNTYQLKENTKRTFKKLVIALFRPTLEESFVAKFLSTLFSFPYAVFPFPISTEEVFGYVSGMCSEVFDLDQLFLKIV